MDIIKAGRHGVQGILLLCLLALIAGQLLGQPILFSYVETGSMEPTLDSGDGFIPIPSEVAGPINEGDVIVFEAESVGGGGLTTHRVVGQTDRGYLTKGDANNAVDQRSDEPPVSEAKIVGKALQVRGIVFTIPHLGSLINGVQSIVAALAFRVSSATNLNIGGSSVGYLLFGVSTLLYLIDSHSDEARDGTRDRARDRSRDTGLDTHLIITGFTILIVLGATVAMVAPSGTHEFGLISSQADTSAVVQTGDTTTRGYQLVNPGLVPSVSFLETEGNGITVDRQEVRLQPGGQNEVTVTLQAPEETGYHRYYLTEHRYIGVLPMEVLSKLYLIHPWLPILAIDGCFGVPFYLLGNFLVDNTRLRNRSRERPRSFLYQLLKKLQ